MPTYQVGVQGQPLGLPCHHLASSSNLLLQLLYQPPQYLDQSQDMQSLSHACISLRLLSGSAFNCSCIGDVDDKATLQAITEALVVSKIEAKQCSHWLMHVCFQNQGQAVQSITHADEM